MKHRPTLCPFTPAGVPHTHGCAHDRHLASNVYRVGKSPLRRGGGTGHRNRDMSAASLEPKNTRR